MIFYYTLAVAAMFFAGWKETQNQRLRRALAREAVALNQARIDCNTMQQMIVSMTLANAVELPKRVALLECGNDENPQTAVLVLRGSRAIPDYRILSVHDTRHAGLLAFNAAVDAEEKT